MGLCGDDWVCGGGGSGGGGGTIGCYSGRVKKDYQDGSPIYAHTQTILLVLFRYLIDDFPHRSYRGHLDRDPPLSVHTRQPNSRSGLLCSGHNLPGCELDSMAGENLGESARMQMDDIYKPFESLYIGGDPRILFLRAWSRRLMAS